MTTVFVEQPLALRGPAKKVASRYFATLEGNVHKTKKQQFLVLLQTTLQ